MPSYPPPWSGNQILGRELGGSRGGIPLSGGGEVNAERLGVGSQQGLSPA